MSSKVSSRLGLLTRIQSCLTLEASKKVYTALVQPLFDYADVAWMKSQKDDAKIFNRLTKPCASMIILRRKLTSKDTLRVLNWLSLARRKKLHKCNLVFKCLNNLVPKILLSFLQGMGFFMIMRLEDETTCTHYSRNRIWDRKLLNMQEQSVITHYRLHKECPLLE